MRKEKRSIQSAITSKMHSYDSSLLHDKIMCSVIVSPKYLLLISLTQTKTAILLALSSPSISLVSTACHNEC